MIITTFSGSKGGVGKTTVAISLSIVSALHRVPTLLVDTSTEGGATSYLLGKTPEPPYISMIQPGMDVIQAMRRLPLGDVELTIAVNYKNPLRNIGWIAQSLQSLDTFPVTIIDLPALTDLDAMKRYLPLIDVSDTVLIVTEPSKAAVDAALYKFERKRLAIALNCPRPYSSVVIDEIRRKYIEPFCHETGARYVVIPYSTAMMLLDSTRHIVLEKVDPKFVTAITELARAVLSKK